MSNKYLLNVSIGPVQEFIAEARKTRDLWIGSYLLSRVTFEVMRPFIEDSTLNLNDIIYPALEQSPFYRKFYKEKNPDREELEVASLPNHFLVIVPENKLDSLIKESKNRLEIYWNSIAESVRQYIKNEFDKIFKGWDYLWEFQVCDLWQYMWVALPVDDNELNNNYQEKAKQIQRSLEERKLTRTFDQWQGSEAIKCTQCGHREVIGPVKLDKISEFWEAIRVKFKANIRKGDRLCAICTIKRFVKSSNMLDGLDEIRFESTRDIAVIPFREFILNHKGELNEKNLKLIDKVTKLKNSIPSYRNMTIRSIRDIGGDFLYKDELTPERLLKEYFPEFKEDSREYNIKKDELKITLDELIHALEDISISEKRVVHPSKYYAILFMDGDDMGKWMSGTLPDPVNTPLTRARHENLSVTLGRLGIKIIPEIIRDFNAYSVYSGGDDLLVLAPLEYAIAIAQGIRDIFGTKGIDAKATVSAGIVIVHYSDSFRKALAEGRKAVERAKAMFNDKDCFSITLMLSSGTVSTGGYKWYFQSDNGKVSTIKDILERLICLQREKILSPRFIYDILSGIQSFYYKDERNDKIIFDRNLFKTETERIFKRHLSNKSKYNDIEILTGNLSDIAMDSTTKHFDVQQNIEGLLRIANFIARESIGN